MQHRGCESNTERWPIPRALSSKAGAPFSVCTALAVACPDIRKVDVVCAIYSQSAEGPALSCINLPPEAICKHVMFMVYC